MATETDKIKTGALGTLVAVGLFATLSVMLAVTALVRYRVRGVSDSRQDLAEQPYKDLRQEQRDKLAASPKWTDKGQGKVSMPIERAKAKVLGELARDPSTATPPAPAQPTGAADATGTAAGIVTGEGAGAAPEGAKAPAGTPEPSAPTPAAPAPAPTHAAVEKKPAPAATVATAKPAAPATAAAAAPTAPAPAAPAAPKPTDG